VRRAVGNMPASPTVSVCVPTYNRSRVLQDCLESILRQSFLDYELVIVDDCSTDDTPEVVHEFKDSRIRYFRNNENVGQMRNLNRCLDVATGEFICMFHDDDVYDPLILEKHLSVFSRHERVGLTHTAVWLLTEAGLIRKLHRVSNSDYVRPGLKAFLDYLRISHDIVFSTAMVRRRCYEDVGRFDPRYLMCADFDMWLRIALSFDIAYIADPLVGYRIHQGSQSQGIRASRWYAEYFEVFDNAIGRGRDEIPGLERMEPYLRSQAQRHEGKRSRLEAASHIAGGEYKVALEYLNASFQMDSSLAGKLSGFALSALRNTTGRVVLRLLRTLRYRFQVVMTGKPMIGKRYQDVSSIGAASS